MVVGKYIVSAEGDVSSVVAGLHSAMRRHNIPMDQWRIHGKWWILLISRIYYPALKESLNTTSGTGTAAVVYVVVVTRRLLLAALSTAFYDLRQYSTCCVCTKIFHCESFIFKTFQRKRVGPSLLFVEDKEEDEPDNLLPLLPPVS